MIRRELHFWLPVTALLAVILYAFYALGGMAGGA